MFLGNSTVLYKFQCQTYWATQFESLRAIYLNDDENEEYIRSLSMTNSWLGMFINYCGYSVLIIALSKYSSMRSKRW